MITVYVMLASMVPTLFGIAGYAVVSR